jgi:hypothetical protein
MVTRPELINQYIDSRGYRKYLEIGVDDPNNTFNHIKAKRTGVDPYNDGTGCHAWGDGNKTDLIAKIDGEFHQMASDDYFDSLHHLTKFDVIFIDGLHEEEQVLRDIENSLKHLSKGGMIFVDDVWPQNELEAVEVPKVGQPWRGTVYRAFWKLRMTRPDLNMWTDRHTMMGVIERGEQKLYNPDLLHKMSYIYFSRFAEAILNVR